MKIVELYRRNPTTFSIYLLLIVIAIVMGGVVLMPSIFYDQWIWKYYWGPTVADAMGGTATHNGVVAHEGYTMVSEITYGIILIIALFAIYKLLKRLKITIDWRFALALMPYIFFGPVSRVLEDTGYFNEPVVYWFISPFICLFGQILQPGFILTLSAFTLSANIAPNLDTFTGESLTIEMTFFADFISPLNLQFSPITESSIIDPFFITEYLQELAEVLHRFYERCRVLGQDKRLTCARLSLILAARIVLSRGLRLLGICAPESM